MCNYLAVNTSNYKTSLVKSADVVRKIISRYLNVLLPNGFLKMRICESEEKYFNNGIELKNFSNNVCTFLINLRVIHKSTNITVRKSLRIIPQKSRAHSSKRTP